MSELIIHEKKISDKHNDSYHYGDRKYYDDNGLSNDKIISNDDDFLKLDKTIFCEANNWFNIGTWEDIKNGNSEIEHTYDEAIETLKELNEGDISNG